MNLDFLHAPKDLIEKFVDCLVQLPNLRTLEIFSIGQVGLTTLARNSSRFPSVRELVINNETACFIVNCPNVETVMTPYRLSYGAMTLGLHGGQLKKLKRVVGVFDGSLPSRESKNMRLEGKFTQRPLLSKCRRAVRTSKRSASKVRFDPLPKV